MVLDGRNFVLFVGESPIRKFWSAGVSVCWKKVIISVQVVVRKEGAVRRVGLMHGRNGGKDMKTVDLQLENLKYALSTAIDARRKEEREILGYDGDSDLVDGWQKVLDAINEGAFPVIIVKGACCGRKLGK